MNIASFLRSVPEPDRPALIFNNLHNSSTTFRELDSLTSRLSAGFHNMGLRTNDRVIILAPISLNLYVSLIALFRLGATAVFLDPQASWQQLNRTAEMLEAKVFIGTRKAIWLQSLLPAWHRIPNHLSTEGNTQSSLKGLIKNNPPRDEIAHVKPETPALITFTNGSTDIEGVRGVIRTHRLLAAQHSSIARALPIYRDDIDMPSFPVVTLHNLASGITSVIPDFPFRRPDTIKPERVLNQMTKYGATTASGSPVYWGAIANHCIANRVPLSLRRIIIGGAPVMPSLVERLSRVAPGTEIVSVYGSTEAEPVALMPASEILSETSAHTARGAGIPLGHPVSDINIKILNAQGAEQPANEAGEIWVSGEHVARKYFSNPVSDPMSKKLNKDGSIWHRMGDLGYQDQNGRLWLVGRVHTTIEKNGLTYHPVPLEAMVKMVPYIRNAALVGVSYKTKQLAVLFVELESDAVKPVDWQSQLKKLCIERGYPLDYVRPIRHIPVDSRHNARIDYARLKALADKYL